jgi:GNAT superfamily N-acetyltransferase
MLGVSGVSVNPPGGFPPAFFGAFSSDDVGARVSVRYEAADAATDVVGDLEALGAERLAIRRSDGSLVVVAFASVVASRVVGPSPASARELEAVSGRSWPAPDEEWLGRWWLRSAGGFTARANAVRPLGDPGHSLDHALAYVNGWYDQRGQPTMIRAVSGSNLSLELDHRGWSSAYESIVEAVTVARLRRLLGARQNKSVGPSVQVQTATVPPKSWLLGYRGGAITPVALQVLTGAPDVEFATIDAAETTAPPVAIGRAAVEPPWVSFAAFEVDPTMRRQGHAHAIMSALTQGAASRGAVRACLEVLAENRAALALYASLGFTEHYRYTYRTPPG